MNMKLSPCGALASVRSLFAALLVLACQSQPLPERNEMMPTGGGANMAGSGGGQTTPTAGSGGMDPGGCAAGLTSCNGSCVSLSDSPANCGACGMACAGELLCSNGACAESCAAGLTQCGRNCVDTNTSPLHCGMCDNACGAGLGCANGACACAAGQTLCDGQCVDTLSDPLHCGACNNACSADECTNGACPGTKDCATRRVVMAPTITDFEDYDPANSPEEYNFSFNAPAGEAGAVYAGTYHYDDETGEQTMSMGEGNDSSYAVGIANTEASDWGGGMGMWMTCIDAAAFDGLSFWVRGDVPSSQMGLNLNMEQTNPPSEEDPAKGGTCEAEVCEAASINFPVTPTWSRVLLPWSGFKPGFAGEMEVPVTGANITGFTLNVQLEWVQTDPDDPESFQPAPASYEVAVDDFGFYIESEVCDAGTTVCGGACVDQQTNNEHCGTCDSACLGGTNCSAGECQCPDGQTYCVDACVDTQTDQYHCGACGNVCALTATCSGGQCQGGDSTTSNRCGSTMQLLGSPFGCEFAWGVNDNGAIPNAVDFASKWVGYEPNLDSTCAGCSWLDGLESSDVVPLYIAYFIAYRANLDAGLGDCNLDMDGSNLCTDGAQWIRDNRSRIISMYESYAERSYAAYPNKPVIWLIEPDLSQYAEPTQSSPMSYSDLGELTTDIVCAVKANMPNAVIALTHSSWLAEPEYSQYWSALPLDLADLVHVTGRGDTGEYINMSDSYNRSDGTWDYLHSITGKPILVDTSFGVTTMEDTWAENDASTLNERIGDGVAGALVYPVPDNYESRISSLSSQLNSTCQ